jgi:mannose-1-phosphate guanylyltransferase
MKAMVLAAGLGTRLRPLTNDIPKPLVPVLDRPVMAHILDLLARHGVTEVIANTHWYADKIVDCFGDRIAYRHEPELLGTAGGVRNCADFFGDETFLVISGDALTGLDVGAFLRRHREAGGIATLAVKHVEDTRPYGVVLHDADGRVVGFQEKPRPQDALSRLANCGIYLFEPEIFDYFPDRRRVDWALDVFPALLRQGALCYVHTTTSYWNDIGSLGALRAATFDALEGRLRLTSAASGLRAGEDGMPNWIGQDVELGKDVRLTGRIVLGDGARIGDGAALHDTIVLPGATVPAGQIAVGAIVSHVGMGAPLRPRRR